MNFDWVIILTSTLFSISCSLLGVYLILRKMAMVGDAISHAVLPGIVIAFLIFQDRNSFFMLVGATILGLLTTFIIQFLSKKAKLQNDAAIGVTFTTLFAFGVILISVFAGQVDLDQDCVLYGEIAYVPLDTWMLGEIEIPKALLTSVIILAVNILLLYLGRKQFKVTSFDPAFASTIGVSLSVWNYLLMGAVSMTTVSAFNSVGAILIIAFMVVPPAIAYLITKKLEQMFVIVAVVSFVVSVLGYYLSEALNGSIAGAVVTVLGLLFFMVFGLKLLIKRIKRKWISAEDQI